MKKTSTMQIGSEDGQTMVEYGLIIGIIVIAILIVISGGLAVKVVDIYQNISGNVNSLS